MTCLRCQVIEAAEHADRLPALVHHLLDQLDRLTNLSLDAALRGVPLPSTTGDQK